MYNHNYIFLYWKIFNIFIDVILCIKFKQNNKKQGHVLTCYTHISILQSTILFQIQ